MVFLLIVRSERWSNLNRPTLNKMLVWRAPTYPPITDPIPQKILPFWESLFSFLFFSNSVSKLFFKIIKSRFLIHRLLLYMHSYSETYKFSNYRSYLRFIERPNSLDMSEDKKMNANPKNWSILPYTASISSCVLGAQKNALIETVLLSTQNTCFGLETKNVRKLIFEVHKTSQFSYSD